MTPLEFLRAVWPQQGYYCIARPAKDFKGFMHQVFPSVEDVVVAIKTHAEKSDLYFCMHTLKEPKVFNPNKLNKKTGEKGAYEVRVQTNTKECRCFFFDLDVGEGTEHAPKYASQEDALFGLKQFCKTTGLPRPVTTSSGGGLHVYWLLEDALPAEEWRVHAAKLKAIAKHFGLLADPMRTTDSSSVLRIPGTYNFKKDEKRRVAILFDGKPMSTAQFIAILDALIVQYGIVVSKTAESRITDELGDNLSAYADRPPVKMESLESVCAQIRKNIENQATASEPVWFHTLNLVRFVEDADTHIHKVSEKHPNYSREETEEKVANQRARGAGPTLCTTLAEFCGADTCQQCPYFGKVKSPLVAAVQFEQATKPAEVVVELDGQTTTLVVPPPPRPYTRRKGGGISTLSKNKDGDEYAEVIYEHDFYPVRRITGEDRSGDSKDHSVWRAILPFEGPKEFSVPSKIIFDKVQLLGFLAERSVIIQHDKGDLIRSYMIAYIAHLQNLEMAERQVNTLGWSSDFSHFTLADKAIHKDGSTKPVNLSGSASVYAQAIDKKGTIEKQIELLQFYNNPAYIANQFFIGASLAAPWLFATGHAGAVLNASGPPGASKSTSLYTAAGLWGKPKFYPMNGTANGATPKARFEKVTVLSNLPICVDELTHIFVKDANAMMMNVSQFNPRERLKRTGDPVKDTAADNPTKSTFMLTTSNNSLHSVLAQDNAAATAGSMRLYEIVFSKSGLHKKYEADEYMRGLDNNYGHIGEAFMMHTVPIQEAFVEQIQNKMREIDIKAKFDSSERFWSAVTAVVLTVMKKAYDLKLLPFDPEAVEAWALEDQLYAMRNAIGSEYTTPLATVADFITKYTDKIIVVRKVAANNTPSIMVVREPRGGMYGHYDQDLKVLWINYPAFNEFCRERAINIVETINGLKAVPPIQKDGKIIGVLNRGKHKFTFGKGTDYASMQVGSFAINMEHPEVSGKLDVNTNPTATLTPPKGDLKVV